MRSTMTPARRKSAPQTTARMTRVWRMTRAVSADRHQERERDPLAGREGPECCLGRAVVEQEEVRADRAEREERRRDEGKVVADERAVAEEDAGDHAVDDDGGGSGANREGF